MLLQVEHQPVSAAAGDAGHHGLAGQAFIGVEDRVAVFGNAVEDADFAGAARASRLTLAWNGGSLDSSAYEYNRDTGQGVWPLGDSPTVLVTALSTESSTATLLPSGRNRAARRRVYTDLDSRLIVTDMLARIGLHERQRVHDIGMLR